MDEVLWLVHDAARELDVSDDAVRYYAKTGQLPAVCTPNGTRLFRPEDVAAFKAKRAEQVRDNPSRYPRASQRSA